MDSQEYKRRLGDRARDIIAYGLGLEKYKPSKKEACCPFHREKTPSFKWSGKDLFWKCFGCGETMDIYRYLKQYKYMSFQEAVVEVANMTGGIVEVSVHRAAIEYKKPKVETQELTSQAIKYMESRKISAQVLKDWRVKQRVWNGKECFVFQYFDENEELPFVSYREIGKGVFKGGCEKDTKQILWGMWHIDISKPVVITEGQPDAIAIWESGYKNVVSVPSGSSNMTWLDNCWEWLQKVQEFIIFGDMDTPGLKLANELVIRLGKHRTKVINHKYKDPNEVLYFEGKEKVLRLIDEATKQAPAGIIDMSTLEYIGIKDKIDEGVPTGFYQLDSTIEDLQPEQLTILVGRNGEGKSTFISQLMCNCIDNIIPIFLYSGEMSSQRILHWLYRQVIGTDQQYLDFVKTKYKTKTEIKHEALEALRHWSSGLFFTYDKSVSNVRKNVNDLFEVAAMAVKRYGCKLVIIDNLMSALEDAAESMNADQSNFVQQCKDFAEGYRVHVILAVHPNKVKKAGEKIEKEDISGSNNIPNKADIILSVEKQIAEDKDCDAKIRLLKDREEGRYKEIKLLFQESTKRLLEIENGTIRQIDYRWKQYLLETHRKQEAIPFDFIKIQF